MADTEQDVVMVPQADQEQQRDVQDWLSAFIQEAHCDAEGVIAFLANLGVTPDHSGQGIGFSQDLLLKIAALIRLRRWERSGLRTRIGVALPSSDEVLVDVVGDPNQKTPRFSGRDLARQILWIHLTQFAWKSWPDGAADLLIIQSAPAADLLDAVASCVWQFRRLSCE
jgi:hypothetical protein